MGVSSIESLVETQKLLNFSNEDLFDIKTTFDNGQSYEELSRLIKTYSEYLNKSSSMKYFGFVGHFSSGKSSTINSILESGDKRKSGLHPVDTGITVITHPDNRDKLLISKSSERLTSGSQLFKAEILKKSVFVDTPGTGDQKILSELVADYLPICDEIIFIISATQPLADSEIPILKEVCQNLDFIPICLVVTRADEFKKDRSKLLDNNNFSADAYSQFESTLKSRLSLIVGDNRFQDSTIVPIDNLDGYGVDDLSEHIRETIDTNDYSINSIKDDFFRAKGKKLLLFFKSYINDKYTELTYLKTKSDQNHKEFSDEARIANNELTENWSNRKIGLKGILSSLNKFHSSITEHIFVTNNFLSGEHKHDLKQFLNEALREQAIEKLNFTIENEQRLLVKNLKKSLLGYDNNDDNFSVTEFLEIVEPKFRNNFYEVYKFIFREHVKYLLESLSWESSNLSLIKSGNERLKKSISKSKYLNKGEEIYTSTLLELDKMMNSYLRLVKLYKAGITSKDLRDTIKKLGLSKLIDNADKIAFSEAQVASWKKELRNGIFPGKYDFTFQVKYTLESSQLIEEIEEKIEELTNQLHAIRSDLEVIHAPVSIDESILTGFYQNFLKVSMSWIAKTTNEIDSVNNKKKEILLEYNSKVFRNALKKAFGSAALTFGFLSALYFGWMIFSRPLGDTIGASLSVGVIGSLIASLVVGAIKFFLNKNNQSSIEYSPTGLYKSKNEIINFNMEALLSSLSDSRKTFSEKAVNYHIIDSRKVIFDSLLGERVNNLCKDVGNVYLQFSELIELHETNVSLPIKQVIDRLDKVDDNLNLLSSISKKIQEKAINPVLAQFKEHSKKLSIAMNDIKAIYEKY